MGLHLFIVQAFQLFCGFGIFTKFQGLELPQRLKSDLPIFWKYPNTGTLSSAKTLFLIVLGKRKYTVSWILKINKYLRHTQAFH